ncbi:MAG: leucyl/phenylalanyl-tRNA--protein transferase [Pseudomonadota bacterium]
MNEFEVINLDYNPNGFPNPLTIKAHPDGLMAVGGNLTVSSLEQAYRRGIFPWFSEGQPYLWWSPDPRCVFFLDAVKVSKNMAKLIRKEKFHVTLNQCFSGVIQNCASIPRSHEEGTWITNEMQSAYIQCHQAGIAHSVEVWFEKKLVGGLYGMSIGPFFFGESMFSLMANTSKIALIYLSKLLQKYQFKLIDCQVPNSHLFSLGAVQIKRSDFITILNRHINDKTDLTLWKEDIGSLK